MMDPRRVPILARSLLRDLLARGLEPRDVVALAAELLDEATQRRIARRAIEVSRDERVADDASMIVDTRRVSACR